MIVNFYKASNEGDPDHLGQARLVEDRVVFEGVSEIENDSHSYGILVGNKETGPQRIYPSDGVPFLKELPYKYSGGRFWAELQENEDE